MPDAPWKDALKRARDPTSAPTRTAAAPSAAALPDPAAVSPELARLMDERRALEARMAGLAGASSAGDPRYTVTPLDQRRAELARWGAARDATRAVSPLPDGRVAPPAPPPALRATPGELPRGAPSPVLRPTPGELVRPTPGALTPDLRRAGLPAEIFERPASPSRPRETPRDRSLLAARDSDPRAEASRRLAAAAESGRALRDAGRALRAPADRARNGPGDPLDRRLEQARDLVGRGRRAYAAAERALDSARDAIPKDWVERARERVPGLGRADPYVREAARKLAVAVGTIDELTEKADQMREMARDVRELREADAAHDDARRDRALERLKAKRSDGARDNAEGDA